MGIYMPSIKNSDLRYAIQNPRWNEGLLTTDASLARAAPNKEFPEITALPIVGIVQFNQRLNHLLHIRRAIRQHHGYKAKNKL